MLDEITLVSSGPWWAGCGSCSMNRVWVSVPSFVTLQVYRHQVAASVAAAAGAIHAGLFVVR